MDVSRQQIQVVQVYDDTELPECREMNELIENEGTWRGIYDD